MEPSTPPGRRTGFPATPATPRLGVWEDHDVNMKRVTHETTLRNPHGIDHAKHNTEKHANHAPLAPGASIFMTPRTTPRRRAIFPPAVTPRGSGRQGKRLPTTPSTHLFPVTPKTDYSSHLDAQTPGRTVTDRKAHLRTPSMGSSRLVGSHSPLASSSRAPLYSDDRIGTPPSNRRRDTHDLADAENADLEFFNVDEPKTPLASRQKASALSDTVPRTREAIVEKDGKKGMWFVFRGKRVFRPFSGEVPDIKPIQLFTTESSGFKDLKPVTLFGSNSTGGSDSVDTVKTSIRTAVSAAVCPHDSEDETDIESP